MRFPELKRVRNCDPQDSDDKKAAFLSGGYGSPKISNARWLKIGKFAVREMRS